MLKKIRNIRTVLALAVFCLVFNTATFGMPAAADDKWDAWEHASKMLKMIEMGQKSNAQMAGNDAVNSIEKAIDKTEDSGKKDKLRDAKAALNKALAYVGDEHWPYAEGEAKKAIAILDSIK